MSAIELTAVLLAVVALVAVAVLALVCARLISITRDLRRALDDVTATVAPAAIDLRDAADRASRQVDRLDDLVRTTGHITETVDAATQVTFRALANPVIKGAAIASGTSRAARRLRGRRRAGRRAVRTAARATEGPAEVFKRVTWFGAGVAAGVGGTVWAHRKVREQMDKARPRQLVNTAAGVAGRVGDVVRDAVAEGRAGAREREVELRSRIDASPSPPLRAVGGRDEGTATTPRGGPAGRR